MLVDKTKSSHSRVGKTPSRTALVSLAIYGATTATAFRTTKDSASVTVDTVSLVGTGAAHIHAFICFTFVAVAILCNVGLLHGLETSCTGVECSARV